MEPQKERVVNRAMISNWDVHDDTSCVAELLDMHFLYSGAVLAICSGQVVILRKHSSKAQNEISISTKLYTRECELNDYRSYMNYESILVCSLKPYRCAYRGQELTTRRWCQLVSLPWQISVVEYWDTYSPRMNHVAAPTNWRSALHATCKPASEEASFKINVSLRLYGVHVATSINDGATL